MPLSGPMVQAPAEARSSSPRRRSPRSAAYIASLAPGPAVPSDEAVDPTKGDPASGRRAVPRQLRDVPQLRRRRRRPDPRQVRPGHRRRHEQAHLRGHGHRPAEHAGVQRPNLTPESKRDIIAFLNTIDEQENPGGMALGSLGPVTEGLFAWVFGLGILVGCAVWLGSKSA